jgi:diaminopimelate decarboxylase
MEPEQQNLPTQRKFYGNLTPHQLAEKYGTPLYIYNEEILRKRCREIYKLIDYKNFVVNYSAKANTNLHLLKIIREEGLSIDAMSPGEIFIEQKAGFKPSDILFICNNVSDAELKFAVNSGVLVSVDSISQLERFGKLFNGERVVVRINPGIGAGHHEKVVTAGKNTKFGVDPLFKAQLKDLVAKYNLKLTGFNQHIGSLFMEPTAYLDAVSFLLSFAEDFPDIEFLDFGGGFGISYHKDEEKRRIDLKELGLKLQKILDEWVQQTGRQITFKVEPGRYIVAECGILLGSVNTLKENGGKKYVGTDLGFNILMRPILYDSYHEIEVYGKNPKTGKKPEKFTVVGNICESGDILAKDRVLEEIHEGDIMGVLDAGAYCMVMSSNYNCRLRPPEVLIKPNGEDVLIRKADKLEDLIVPFL